MYKILPFVALILASADLFSQSSEFDELLSLFETNRTEIPRELAVKYFDYQPDEITSELQTAGVIIKTTNFIALLTFASCAAGGVCESSGLTTLDYSGNQIDAIPFENAMGDCSFLNQRSIEFTSDTLLIFQNSNEKNNCETDRIVSLEIFNEYIFVNPDGTFEDAISKRVNGKREYYMVSSQLLSEEELQEFSKGQLAIMRNEIFAAYGYKFKSEKWKSYFKSKSWYNGVNKEQEKNLSLLERFNLESIKKLEGE